MRGIETHKLLVGSIVVGAALLVGSIADHMHWLGGDLNEGGNVSTKTAALRAASASSTSLAHEGKININTADENDLQTLSGIGASKAQSIVAYRDAHGQFQVIEDIMQVRGIGKAMFEKIRDDITVGTVAASMTKKSTNPISVTHTAAAATVAPSLHPKIFIHTVMPGRRGGASDEYIELYNPELYPADLTGWSIKKKSGNGTWGTFVSAARVKGKSIPPGKYFLIANPSGYAGATVADANWPASYSLPQSGGELELLDESGVQVDTVSWQDVPDGSRCVRASAASSCVYQEDASIVAK